MQKINIEEKLDTVLSALWRLRMTHLEPVTVSYTEEIGNKQALPVDGRNWRPFEAPWNLYDQDRYYWFHGEFDVPALPQGHSAWLCIETFIYGVACTIRPQGLLYLNGQIVQGVDINHTDIPVKEGHNELYLLFYSHFFERSLPVHFNLKYRVDAVEELYYDLRAPLEALKLLDKRSDAYIFSAAELEKAVNLLDFRKEGSREFLASVDAARAYLKENYYEKLCGSLDTVNCIGHTHIDVAWLWTLEHTRDKIERSFSTVLKMMEEFPEYRFMSSQPQLYQYLKERNPEMYAKVKERVAQGRWEVEGSLWLEADCNLTSGESLVRQVVEGKRFFREEFGKECHILWEPDVFGYSAALPQIMKKAGITHFVTSKIGLNDHNRMPYDTFIWKGIDGSQVLAFLISTCECDPRTGKYDDNETTYVARMSANQILGTWNRYQPKEFNRTTMMTYGWGDGGGGPTRQMLHMQRRFAWGLPGIPKTKIATVEETLDEVERNFLQSSRELRRQPVWNGEIYFEYHRGTLTSVPRVKKNNRAGEFALQNSEFYSSLASVLCGAEYPRQELKEAWKLLLLNQFHDILPGSAIREVYEESDAQFATIFAAANRMDARALQALAGSEGNGLLVCNPNGFPATGTVQLDGVTRVVENIPALGYAAQVLAQPEPAVQVGRRSLENKDYRLIFGDDGAILSLLDKRVGRELVKPGEKLNALVAFEDMPYQYDNWEIAPYHFQKSWALDADAEFAPLEDGDRAGLRITKRYFDSVIVQEVWLYSHGIDRIDFVTNMDWREKNQLLKAHFPLDMLIDRVTCDIQFGSAERNTHCNTSWDAAKFEFAAQKWVDMSEHNYGVALLNDGKYGFGAQESTLSMTLVKSGSYPYDGASEDVPTFTYSLLPHRGDWRTGGVVEKAYVLNRPLTAVTGSGCATERFSLVSCEGSGVFVETVKQADDGDGLILRMFEAFKETKTVTLHFGISVEAVWICDLLENRQEALQICGNSVTISVKPFEIVTLRVK